MCFYSYIIGYILKENTCTIQQNMLSLIHNRQLDSIIQVVSSIKGGMVYE